MRNLKKILALVLALMMVLSVMVTASAAEYADADEIKYTQAVEVMSELTVLQGDGENFNPKGELTRAEAAVILTKILLKGNLKTLAKEADAIANPFTDVSATHWGLDYIKYCYNEGLIIGNGKGNFYPTQKLTGYAFAKTLLIAAGVGESDDYLTDATGTWESKVLADANKYLLGGLGTIKMSANITREEAAQMALNALKIGGVDVVTYYVVASDYEGTVPPTTANTILKTSDYLEAYVMAELLDAKIVRDVKNTGSLLSKNFGVVYTGNAHDPYGRPGVSYTFKAGTAYAYTWNYNDAPVATFNTKTTAAGVIAALGAYDVYNATDDEYYLVADTTEVGAWDVAVYKNGGAALGETLVCAEIAALTGYNQVVEVYTDYYGTIDEIVVVETKVGQVTKIDKASALYGTPEYYYVNGIKTGVNTAGYELYDLVTYTQTVAGKVTNVAPANIIMGTLTSFTNTGVYTINGTNYYIDLVYSAGAAADAQSMLARPAYYILGNNNSILAVANVSSAIINNFALVIDAKMEFAPAALWGDVTKATVQVKAILSDGTCAIYDLPVETDWRGDLYIKVDGTVYYLTDKTGQSYTKVDSTEDLMAVVHNNIYTYTLADGVITLAEEVDASGANRGYTYAGVASEIEGGDLAVTVNGSTYAVNSDTVTILKANALVPDVYTTTVGTSAIGKTGGADLTGAYAIYQLTFDAKGNPVWTVTHIFSETYVATTTVSTVNLDNYVYVSGVYTVTTDVTGAQYYTYVAYKADGSVVDVVSKNVEKAPGIYVYNANLKSVGSLIDGTKTAVTYISGTTYNIGGYCVVTDATAVVTVTPGAQLGLNAGVYHADINGDTLVDVIYVVTGAY